MRKREIADWIAEGRAKPSAISWQPKVA